MLQWLYVHLGISGVGGYYGFWSGFGSDLGEVTIVAAILGMLKKHNCHQRWCFRFGVHELHDPETGLTYQLCGHHHPDHPGHHLTGEIVNAIHHRRKVAGL